MWPTGPMTMEVALSMAWTTVQEPSPAAALAPFGILRPTVESAAGLLGSPLAPGRGVIRLDPLVMRIRWTAILLLLSKDQQCEEADFHWRSRAPLRASISALAAQLAPCGRCGRSNHCQTPTSTTRNVAMLLVACSARFFHPQKTRSQEGPKPETRTPIAEAKAAWPFCFQFHLPFC